ncbi:MAG: Flagellar L-ring protein precursor [Pseudomonadota bacterium]|jgi:flagellar L-ring protein precursor FlgH
MTFARSTLALGLVCMLQACAVDNTDLVLRPSPEFAPVYPLASDRDKAATGGIYSNRQSDAWFGRGRNYQVGDIITVLLNEQTQAARTQNSEINRDSKNTLPSGVNKNLGRSNRWLEGIDVNNNAIDSKSKGTADQQASLVGSIAVTVVEILANGNLLVKGEKKLGLSEGTEVIQVSGIIRPEDVGPNSTVQSRRLANAQIAYRGSGDLANAARPGWGTRFMHSLWPF